MVTTDPPVIQSITQSITRTFPAMASIAAFLIFGRLLRRHFARHGERGVDIVEARMPHHLKSYVKACLVPFVGLREGSFARAMAALNAAYGLPPTSSTSSGSTAEFSFFANRLSAAGPVRLARFATMYPGLLGSRRSLFSPVHAGAIFSARFYVRSISHWKTRVAVRADSQLTVQRWTVIPHRGPRIGAGDKLRQSLPN